MNSENIIKKKVKPYPIECVLTGKAQPVNGKIVKSGGYELVKKIEENGYESFV